MNTILSIIRQHTGVAGTVLAFALIALLQTVRFSFEEATEAQANFKKIAQSSTTHVLQVAYEPETAIQQANEKIRLKCLEKYPNKPHLVEQCQLILKNQHGNIQ